VQSTPLLSRNGRVLGMISTHWSEPHQPSERDLGLLDILARLAADLLERRQSEDALRDADRRKDEFLATLAHELRNPLAPVRSAVDLMEDRLPPDADLVWARDVIDRQVSLMSRLLDDLLDVGRIAQDRLELRKERLDLRAVIQTSTEISRPLIAGFKHELRVMLPDKPVYVDADPARLSQVFGNLLNNACRYTPPAGHISVTVEQADGQAVVRVRDSGIGIRPAELLNIFEMFFQADQSAERTQSGLGIGLHLARRLVEMHGGMIEAQSRGQGEGSEFIVRLPLAAGEAPAAAVAPRDSRDQRPARPRRILVVDDNVDAAMSLMMLLNLDGHEVHVAHDGASALELAEREQPDVMLLDIGLPRLNGYDVCRRIREQTWGQRMMIIAVTGWGQDLDRRKSEEAGFNYHLVKPVEHAALVKLLASEPELV
jgi:signal transduction histidine kinase